MILVGLAGGIGHGKTTFASLLAGFAKAPEHFESWQIISEVADYLRQSGQPHPAPNDISAINNWLMLLPEAVLTCMHLEVRYEDIKLTDDRLDDHPEYYRKLFSYLQLVAARPELADSDITAANKEQFRALLQWLGGYLVITVGSGIWYDEIVRRTAYLQTTSCDLVTVSGLRYPGDAERLRNAGGCILQINRPSTQSLDSTDLTERDRSLIQPDSVITNNGSLADLGALATTVFHHLQLRELRPTYRAAS